MLIPAYRDMDPYDLPEAFSHLQAQDMSKLGIMQDLIRGIKKILEVDKPAVSVVKEAIVNATTSTVEPLLKRVFMFLEDEEWESANKYCEKVLDIDPENAYAYLGKLMVNLNVNKQENLIKEDNPFDDNIYFQKTIRFANENLKSLLCSYIEYINTRNENTCLEELYINANDVMSTANTENDYKEAASIFDSIIEYKDSKTLAQICYKNAEIKRKDALLLEGKNKMKGSFISDYETAIKIFETIAGWKDADQMIFECKNKVDEIKRKMEEKRLEQARIRELTRKEKERILKRNKRISIILALVIIIVAVYVIILNTVVIPNNKYNNAIALMNEGKMSEAYELFISLDGYKDSKENANLILYNEAIALMNEGKIVQAYETLVSLEEYKDSKEKAKSIYDKYQKEKIKAANIGDYVVFGTYEQNDNKSDGKEDLEWLVIKKKDNKVLLISKHVLELKYFNDYTDTTWDNCSLRKWLNGEFINTAFNNKEKDMISTVKVPVDENTYYKTDSGKVTNDKVFLLSMKEALELFETIESKICTLAWKHRNYAWWLRTPGESNHHYTFVDIDGVIVENGRLVNSLYGVRPALWID